jgi:hypothetical protein
MDNPPADAGDFIGEGDGGDVEAASSGDIQRPGSEVIGHVCGGAGAERRASPVDQHHAQVAVPSFGDAAEPADLACGVFSRRQPEVSGEVSTRAEAVQITDKGDQGVPSR